MTINTNKHDVFKKVYRSKYMMQWQRRYYKEIKRKS